MDKIHQIADSALITQKPSPGKLRQGDFQSALAKVLTPKGSKNSPTRQNMPLGEITSVYPPSIESGPAESITRAEQLLGMLDNFTSQLGNPDKSLRDLAPLMSEIKDKAGELTALSEDMPPTDGDLKKILDSVALTATVEYVKFYRGDLM